MYDVFEPSALDMNSYLSGDVNTLGNTTDPNVYSNTTKKKTHGAFSKAFPGKNPSAPGGSVDITKRMSKLGKGMLIGAAIAASAFVLWSATRQKREPITDPQGTQESLYGEAQQGTFSASGPMSGPVARIARNNTGYETTVNLEAEDSNDVMDYNGIARTMSDMSSAATGVNATTSLHVTDESSSINDRSIQRQFQEYLRG